MKTSRQRYQRGSLITLPRADGRVEWVLRYRVTLVDGSRPQRQAVVGTTKEYPTESQAQAAADSVRLTINKKVLAAQQPTVQAVAVHFKETELQERCKRRSWSTKQKYKYLMDHYILPRWGTTRMLEVETVEVEAWLDKLTVTRGGKKTPRKEAMADPTKQTIRNTFATVFTHAQRYKFVPPGHNPIKLVRQSGKRSRVPDILTPSEINGLWHGSSKRERAAIAIEYGNGLRISEAIGLKWSDIDFEKASASVTKAVVQGHVGEVKTEVSRKSVPLHLYQIEDLKAWRAVAPYNGDDDWVFASPRSEGRKPYWPHMILKRHIQRTAKNLGINKRIGWHTFRRTYASLLKANHEDVKVVQELLRHANITTTMNLYAQAFSDDAREAQGKIVEMVRKAPLPVRLDQQERRGAVIVP